MKGKPIDLVGERFDKLRVVKKIRSSPSGALWLCECSCGGTVEKYTSQLRRKGARRIGCKACETISRSAAKVKHGGKAFNSSHKKLYSIWKEMRQRCSNPNSKVYSYYGLKGIAVCSDWSEFSIFREWAFSNGYRPGLSIDRLDSEGDYYPANCEWVTRSENSKRVKRKGTL